MSSAYLLLTSDLSDLTFSESILITDTLFVV